MNLKTSRSVGSFEAKTHLPRLLDEVAAGAEIVITKRGTPVAKLVAIAASADAENDAFIEDWFAYRKRRGLTSGGQSLRAMIDEGRRPI